VWFCLALFCILVFVVFLVLLQFAWVVYKILIHNFIIDKNSIYTWKNILNKTEKIIKVPNQIKKNLKSTKKILQIPNNNCHGPDMLEFLLWRAWSVVMHNIYVPLFSAALKYLFWLSWGKAFTIVSKSNGTSY